MNSTELIEKAKTRFKELEYKKYDWESFYNAYLQGYGVALLEFKKCNLPDINKQRELLIAFKDHWNTNNDIRSEEIEVADVDNYLCDLQLLIPR